MQTKTGHQIKTIKNHEQKYIINFNPTETYHFSLEISNKFTTEQVSHRSS